MNIHRIEGGSGEAIEYEEIGYYAVISQLLDLLKENYITEDIYLFTIEHITKRELECTPMKLTGESSKLTL